MSQATLAALVAAIFGSTACYALEPAKGLESLAQQCSRVRANAEEIMGYRQDRKPVLEVLAMVETVWPNHTSRYWERAVTDAYDTPAFENEPYRGRAIADFGERHELQCVKDEQVKTAKPDPKCDQIAAAISNRAIALATEHGMTVPMSQKSAENDLAPLLMSDPIAFTLMISSDGCPKTAADPRLIQPE
ncbi:MAG: hypothetical protein QM699_07770 [Amaricoccus sp.]|uniref:hypothetical protein n=1 Tax=Amaricoccus sp. TaxID=1872485 RepID=UPI0039E23175